MSRAPFMDPTPIAIIAIHEMTFVSAYEDECPIARGRELTDRLIHTKRAMPQTSVKLINLFSDLVRNNPRRLSASFDRHSTMLERMAAIGRMDPVLADQFEDGQTATICSHRLVDELSSVMRDKANPPMCKKPISGQSLRYAAFHCPHGTDALATEIINALPSERGAQAVLEFDAAGAPRIHFVTTGETIRQSWARVVQKNPIHASPILFRGEASAHQSRGLRNTPRYPRSRRPAKSTRYSQCVPFRATRDEGYKVHPGSMGSCRRDCRDGTKMRQA